jgi:hypothetical protein
LSEFEEKRGSDGESGFGEKGHADEKNIKNKFEIIMDKFLFLKANFIKNKFNFPCMLVLDRFNEMQANFNSAYC